MTRRDVGGLCNFTPQTTLREIAQPLSLLRTKNLHSAIATFPRFSASAKGQYPAAMLLTCIDSRAPAEILLDLGIGDVFNSRIAGNIVNEDILGSMEFACELSGAKLVVVMGHTSCGAIKGAINHTKLGNLTALLAKIIPAVDATVYEGERTSNNYNFVNAVARTNIEFTIRDIRAQSPVLSGLEKAGKIKIVGAMYNVGNGIVDFYDEIA